MDKTYFITLTGVKHYFGMKPFEPGRVVKLVKDPQNEYDAEAVSVELPYIDRVAYVANSAETVARGTCSAGRIYDLFETFAYARVLFITHASIICVLILPDEEAAGDGDKDPDAATEKGDKRKEDFSDEIEDGKPATGFISHDGKGFCVNILEF